MVRVSDCKVCGKPFEQEIRRGRPRTKCDTCSGVAAPSVIQPSVHRVPSDPPVRADGRCACGCGRRLPRTKQARMYAGAQIEIDPFATADCCRRSYGVSWAMSEEEQEASDRKRRGGQQAADQFNSRRGYLSTPGVFA